MAHLDVLRQIREDTSLVMTEHQREHDSQAGHWAGRVAELQDEIQRRTEALRKTHAEHQVGRASY
jgi:hypothetical protein